VQLSEHIPDVLYDCGTAVGPKEMTSGVGGAIYFGSTEQCMLNRTWFIQNQAQTASALALAKGSSVLVTAHTSYSIRAIYNSALQ